MDGTNGWTGATSQMHGIGLEDVVLASGAFLPGAVVRSHGALVDVEGRYDPVLGLDTFVKATGSAVIGLADATRFYELDRTVRFLIGRWSQTRRGTKTIPTVLELLVTVRALDRLRGGIGVDEIRAMHDEIASFPAGPAGAVAARARAAELKNAAHGRHGFVSLDFKIDELKQRRLQLSVKTRIVENVLQEQPAHVRGGVIHQLRTVHRGRFHLQTLPVEITSVERRFQDPDASPQQRFDDGALGPVGAIAPDGDTTRRRSVRKDESMRRAAVLAGPIAQPMLI